MAYLRTINFQSDITVVSNRFIDTYLPSANATFVKVYLYALRKCNSGETISDTLLAKDLGILESDVVNAWQYWEERGVISRTEEELVFLSPDVAPADRENTTKPTGKQTYTPAMIADAIKGNKALKELYDFTQQRMGKVLSPSEIQILFSLYDWLHLPTDVIVMLLEHCASIGKLKMRYIEKVAISWVEQGLTSIEAVENHFLKEDQEKAEEELLCQLLDIQGRRLTTAEKNYYKEWRETLCFEDSVIRLAYEQTVQNTGKLSFAYMNTVLKNWHQEGLRDQNAVLAKLDAHRSTPKRGTKFHNFNQESGDTAEVEQAVLKKLMERTSGRDVG